MEAADNKMSVIKLSSLSFMNVVISFLISHFKNVTSLLSERH